MCPKSLENSIVFKFQRIYVIKKKKKYFTFLTQKDALALQPQKIINSRQILDTPIAADI